MRVIRKKLTPSDVFPANTRYDSEHDVIQTYDGTTWVDTPERDPRTNNAFPSPGGADPRCDGAARMSAFIQETVETIIDGVDDGKNDAELALIVLGVLALIPFIDLLIILVSVLVGALIIAGSSFLHATFDAFDWSDLTAIIYCRVRDDGFIDDEALAYLQADITAGLATDPASIINDVLNIVGRGGLNDAAALRTETGDCGSYTCTWDICLDLSYVWSLMQPQNSPNPGCPANLSKGSQGTLGSYGGRPAIVAQKTLGDGANRIGKRFLLQLPEGSTITRVEYSFERPGYNTDQFTKVIGFNGTYYCVSGAFHNSPVAYNVNLTGDVMVYWGLGTTVASDGSTVYYRQLRLIGTGVKPTVPTVSFAYP